MAGRLAILSAVITAFCFSQSLYGMIYQLVYPQIFPGQTLSASAPFLDRVLFTLLTCVCAGFAMACFCFARRLSLTTRGFIVVAPMILTAGALLVWKAIQYQRTLAWATAAGIPLGPGARSLFIVPGGALAASLLTTWFTLWWLPSSNSERMSDSMSRNEMDHPYKPPSLWESPVVHPDGDPSED